MTTPDAQPPAEERPEPAQAATGPTVTTAPPPRARRWSRLPSHVGPARTSTIVLAILFVGIFVLYLDVRPNPPATAGSTGTTSGTQQQGGQPAPVTTRTPTPTRTTTPATPTRTSSTAPSGTTSGARTTSSTPSETTGAPGGTSGTSATLPSLPASGSAPTS